MRKEEKAHRQWIFAIIGRYSTSLTGSLELLTGCGLSTLKTKRPLVLRHGGQLYSIMLNLASYIAPSLDSSA